VDSGSTADAANTSSTLTSRPVNELHIGGQLQKYVEFLDSDFQKRPLAPILPKHLGPT